MIIPQAGPTQQAFGFRKQGQRIPIPPALGMPPSASIGNPIQSDFGPPQLTGGVDPVMPISTTDPFTPPRDIGGINGKSPFDPTSSLPVMSPRPQPPMALGPPVPGNADPSLVPPLAPASLTPPNQVDPMSHHWDHQFHVPPWLQTFLQTHRPNFGPRFNHRQKLRSEHRQQSDNWG